MTEPLTSDAMSRFLRDGYVTVDAGRPADFHRGIYEQLEKVFEEEGNPGNNILPRVPDIQQVLRSGPVHDALSSIVGRGYHLHAHRYCHDRPAQTEAQRLHKDAWSRLHHRTRWCMALYYPQDTTADMGPTGVVPGSQYCSTQPSLDTEVALSGTAGTVTIVHYDIWHRGLDNTSDRRRFMLKFLFARMEEPTAPNGMPTADFDADDPRAPLWNEMWRWQTGREVQAPHKLSPTQIHDLAGRLTDAEESASFQAAYQLGAGAALQPLVDAIRSGSGNETTRRNAGYGLSAAGAVAVPALVDCLTHADAGVRVAAIDSLADMGLQAAPAVSAMETAITDADPEVRQRAAYALGTTGAQMPAPALLQALYDDDDNVARNASLTLARLGPRASDALPELGRALHHPNRYVQANALKALHRIDSEASRALLYEHLSMSRWCSITSNTTPY